MRLEELMVGDLVYSSFSDIPCKVQYLELRESGYGSVKTSNVDGIKDIASLYPIPLTPEILEKNGIVYDYDEEECVADYHYIKLKGYQYYDDDVLIDYCNGRIKIVRDITGSIEIEEIKYVHELQHALKLCGIEKTIEL